MMVMLRAALALAVMVMIAGARRRIRLSQNELFFTCIMLRRSKGWPQFPGLQGYLAFLSTALWCVNCS